MPRFLAFALAFAPAACATAPQGPQAIDERSSDVTPSPAQILAQSRARLLEDATTVLGASALAEVMAAPTAVLVRSSTSFPRMTQQPDGSFKPEPPGVAAAVRTSAGWVRIGAAAVRHSFDAVASSELDRMLGSSAFWAEAPITSAPCTDPSGIIMLARHRGREFVSPYPCGFTGVTGQLARLVLAGRITDWGSVPPHLRPAGLPLARFDEAIQGRFRHHTGLYEERMIAIRDEAEWQGQWLRMTRPLGQSLPLPPVDFRRDMLLLAAMGPRPSGGYRVEIERVIDQGDELLAIVRFVSPGPGCGATMAVTSPADIVRLPRSEKVVRWLVERVATDCR